MRGSRIRNAVAIACLALTVTLGGCATTGTNAYKLGNDAAGRQDWDLAVLYYTQAVQESPNDVERQIALEKAKLAASNVHFERARVHLGANNLEEAIVELQQAVNLHPANQFAFTELQKAVAKLRDQRAVESGTKTELELMKERAKQPIGSPPKLDPASDVEISIEFDEEELSKILEALGAIYGINFLYDDTVRKEQEMTVNLTGVSFEEALELIMLQSGNNYTVISENTMMVYPDTQSKQREWQDQVIKTFYLSNADVNDVNSLLRTLIESRRVSINKQLNAISIRDTLDKIAIADQIIRANDKAKSEVIIDVELYQVDRSLLQTLGIDLQPKSMGISHNNAESGLPLNYLNPLGELGAWVVSPIPTITLQFLRTHSLARALARPRVRATEGERVSLHIGDQVPIPNTTFSASQTVGGNIVPITSFTYQNVGIQIQVEPRVHHNKEVTLKMELEVSRITSTNSSGQPTIGTRQVNTVIRLKDGETNLLAGLFSEEDVKGLSTIPGLDDIPGVRKAFGTRDRNLRQTDILLTLTPRIIRIPDIREADLRPLWVGTERNIRMRNKGALAGGYSAGVFTQESAEDAFELFRNEQESFDDTEIDDLLREPEPQPSAPDEAPVVPLLQEPGEAGAPPASEPPPAAAPPGTGTPPAQPAVRGTSRNRSARPDPSAGVARNPSGSRTTPPPDESGSQPAPRTGSPSAGTPELSLSPASVQVARDGTTRMQVRLDTAGHEIVSIPFYVKYDSSIVQLTAIEEGPFLASSGRNALFQSQIQDGRGIVGAALTGTGPGASGSGHVATLVFRGKEAGTSVIQLENVHPSTVRSGEVGATTLGGTVTVR